MVLASLLFIRRVADTTTVSAVTEEYVQEGHAHSLQHQVIPGYVRIFRIHGPFLFGATEKLRVITDAIDGLPEIVVLRLRNMTALDGTGLRAIEDLADALHRSGRALILCGAKHQPSEVLARADFQRRVGRENICPNVGVALDRAVAIHKARAGRAQESVA